MSNDDQGERSAAMASADTANGEGNEAEGSSGSRPTPTPPRTDDPDAPGLSALDPRSGDAVEPNEPA